MAEQLLRSGEYQQTGRDYWHRRVAISGDRPFLRVAKQTWTFTEADRRMRRLAAGLRELGVQPGTRVAVGLENTADIVFSHLAVAELGAVMVALVPGLGPAELAYQINHADVEVLITDGRVADAVLPLDLPSVRAVVTRNAIAGSASQAARMQDFDQVYDHEPLVSGDLPGHGPMSPAVIMYTSGSTAVPKGVVLPAGTTVDVGTGFARRFGVTGDDVFLLPFTAAHGVGGLVVPSMVLAVGCEVALEPSFSVSRFWPRVQEVQATVTLLFPAQLQLLRRYGDQIGPRQTSLRLAITHVYDEAFRDRFGVETATVWACTEGGSHGAGSEIGYRGGRGDGYVGPPFEGTGIEIRDPAGHPLPAGEIGEIFVRQPYVMIGYLNDPAGTAAVKADGWIACGDLGALEPDGALIYHGRLKNMVKRSGESISPEQVENTLREHPAVVDAVVFGVPDPVRTEELAAVIHLRQRVPPLTLTGFVADRLARWKAPRYISVVDEPLPRLPNGKLDKVGIRDQHVLDQAWDRERATST
jgi:long-chain acyl-CoA synthetase